jgi:Transposase DNA-binding
MSWVTEELRDVDLGDVRRNRRLIQIVEDLAGSPESSVPLASRDRAALQGMYDFWSNRRIAASDILVAHAASAVNRSECNQLVLAIQDTTELDYSHHSNKRGLGYLRGANTRGLLLHSVLAVDPGGTPLGILDHQLWARQGRGTQRQRRELVEKESYRWIKSLHQTESLLSPSTHILTIADREADFYDFIAAARRPNSDYLIRIHHDRPVKLNPEDAPRSLPETC